MPDFGSNVAGLQQYSIFMEKGLSQVFKDDLPTHEKMYEPWLREKTASEWIEDEVVMTGLGQMAEKGLGGPIQTDKPFVSTPKDFTIIPYALGFVGEYELVRWDQYHVFKNMTKMLTASGIEKMNILAHAVLNNSFSTADPVYTTYRNEALCSNSHTLFRSGTGKNAPTNPTDVSFLSIQEAITDFMLLTNEDGLFTKLEPSCLVVHPSQKWIADTLVGSKYRPDNPNENLNVLKSQGAGGSALTTKTSPFLTSTGAWWLLANKKKLQVSFHVGDKLMFRRAFDISTWNNVFTMYGSFRAAVLHWYGIWGSAGT